MLDLVLTNSAEKVYEVPVVDGIVGSDHDAVVMINMSHSEHSYMIYNFKKADFDHFRELLGAIPCDCRFR